MEWDLPTEYEEWAVNSCSSGDRNEEKMSIMNPLEVARISRMSWLTMVSKMIGRMPSRSAAALICWTMLRAFSGESM